MIQDLELLRTEDYKKKLDQCIHCGLCLQACPTYAVFGTEMDGPRGRIALIRAASEELIELEEFKTTFTEHIALCLACRACETACPSGVQYGSLVEMARTVAEHNRQPGRGERFLRWVGTQQLMTHLGQLKFLARLLWLYQKIGLQRVVRALNFLPKPLKAMEDILPPITPRYQDYSKPAPPLGPACGTVLFFTGCIQEGFLSPVNQATVRVLQRNGFAVHTPQPQTCCGAAHLHLGDLEMARRLARQNIDAFIEYEDTARQEAAGSASLETAGGAEVVILTNAGGCGVALKEYPHLLADDPVYAGRAARFSARVKDINEFLIDHLTFVPQGEIPRRATYADSCHLRHGQKVVKQPRELLKMVPGLQLVELATPERCCGSAGVYNITQSETADQVLEAKMADIAATKADLIVTSNTGCQMQLIAGVRRAGLKAQVMHVMEVLDLSYRTNGKPLASGIEEEHDDSR